MDDGMRRIRLDQGQEEGADASIPPLYMPSRRQMTTASSQATMTAEADETPSLPHFPPPAPTTPPRRRNGSGSTQRQKNSKFRVVTTAGAAGSGSGGGTSASPRVAIENLVSTPGSTGSSVIAAALGNASSSSDAMLSDVLAVVDDNSRNTATMLSDSTWEREIAEFGRILDDMLTRVTCRDLVKKTAEFMKEHPQHSIRFQIKIKQVKLL